LATTLTFHRRHDYGHQAPDGITVPVQLTVGQSSVRLHAKLDTGASFCIFEREYGEQLGFNVESGREVTVFTVNSRFQVYGHEVTITCFDWTFASEVFFAGSLEIHRNVLGRRGWLQQFRMALIDYDSVLHLSHYDQL